MSTRHDSLKLQLPERSERSHVVVVGDDGVARPAPLSLLRGDAPRAPGQALTPAELSALLDQVAGVLAGLSAAVPGHAPAPAAEPAPAPRIPLVPSVPPLTPMRLFVVPQQRPRTLRRRMRNWLAEALGLPASCRA